MFVERSGLKVELYLWKCMVMVTLISSTSFTVSAGTYFVLWGMRGVLICNVYVPAVIQYMPPVGGVSQCMPPVGGVSH